MAPCSLPCSMKRRIPAFLLPIFDNLCCMRAACSSYRCALGNFTSHYSFDMLTMRCSCFRGTGLQGDRCCLVQEMTELAARLIGRLAHHDQNKNALREAGAITALLKLLRHNKTPPKLQEAVAQALTILVVNNELNQDYIRYCHSVLRHRFFMCSWTVPWHHLADWLRHMPSSPKHGNDT